MLFLVAQTFFLLLVATIVGVAAGWLIWGGPKRTTTSTASVESVAKLTAELEQSQADVESRSADVARLRRKLKRAVEELERHATQLESAEEQICALSSGGFTGATFADTSTTDAELAGLRSRLAEAEAALASATAEVERLRAEHAAVSDQLRFAQARAEALETELHSLRQAAATDDERSGSAARRSAELESQLADAQTVIRDATARVTYLEQQALLWQNEADRLQAVLDEGSSSHSQELTDLHQQLINVQRDHETAASALRLDASNSRLRADAAADQLARLQQEFRLVQERSHSLMEANRAALADIDRQLAATHSTLNDSNPKAAPLPIAEVPHDENEVGLEALPGITPGLIDHLHELGVGSLADVASWSPDDVARIAAWLPENPGVISANNWVEAAQTLLAGGVAAGVANGG